MSITRGTLGSPADFLETRFIVRGRFERPLGFLPVGFFPSPVLLPDFPKVAHTLIPYQTYCRLNLLRVLRDYHTKFAHSVSTISFFFFFYFFFFFFYFFFWLTHAISHRNIVFFLRSLFHALPLSFSRRVQILHSLPLILAYIFRSFSLPDFAPPLRSYRAREKFEGRDFRPAKTHHGEITYFLSLPLLFFLIFSVYTTAP